MTGMRSRDARSPVVGRPASRERGNGAEAAPEYGALEGVKGRSHEGSQNSLTRHGAVVPLQGGTHQAKEMANVPAAVLEQDALAAGRRRAEFVSDHDVPPENLHLVPIALTPHRDCVIIDPALAAGTDRDDPGYSLAEGAACDAKRQIEVFGRRPAFL